MSQPHLHLPQWLHNDAETGFRIRRRRLTLLVGADNVGKSTLMSTLRGVGMGKCASEEDESTESPRPRCLNLEFSMNVADSLYDLDIVVSSPLLFHALLRQTQTHANGDGQCPICIVGVYAIDSRKSFDDLRTIMKSSLRKSGCGTEAKGIDSDVPLLLLGTKRDREADRHVAKTAAADFAAEYNGVFKEICAHSKSEILGALHEMLWLVVQSNRIPEIGLESVVATSAIGLIQQVFEYTPASASASRSKVKSISMMQALDTLNGLLHCGSEVCFADLEAIMKDSDRGAVTESDVHLTMAMEPTADTDPDPHPPVPSPIGSPAVIVGFRCRSPSMVDLRKGRGRSRSRSRSLNKARSRSHTHSHTTQSNGIRDRGSSSEDDEVTFGAFLHACFVLLERGFGGRETVSMPVLNQPNTNVNLNAKAARPPRRPNPNPNPRPAHPRPLVRSQLFPSQSHSSDGEGGSEFEVLECQKETGLLNLASTSTSTSTIKIHPSLLKEMFSAIKKIYRFFDKCTLRMTRKHDEFQAHAELTEMEKEQEKEKELRDPRRLQKCVAMLFPTSDLSHLIHLRHLVTGSNEMSQWHEHKSMDFRLFFHLYTDMFGPLASRYWYPRGSELVARVNMALIQTRSPSMTTSPMMLVTRSPYRSPASRLVGSPSAGPGAGARSFVPALTPPRNFNRHSRSHSYSQLHVGGVGPFDDPSKSQPVSPTTPLMPISLSKSMVVPTTPRTPHIPRSPRSPRTPQTPHTPYVSANSCMRSSGTETESSISGNGIGEAGAAAVGSQAHPGSDPDPNSVDGSPAFRLAEPTHPDPDSRKNKRDSDYSCIGDDADMDRDRDREMVRLDALDQPSPCMPNHNHGVQRRRERRLGKIEVQSSTLRGVAVGFPPLDWSRPRWRLCWCSIDIDAGCAYVSNPLWMFWAVECVCVPLRGRVVRLAGAGLTEDTDGDGSLMLEVQEAVTPALMLTVMRLRPESLDDALDWYLAISHATHSCQ